MTPREIAELMAERIAAEFHPRAILLFGSLARGDAGPDSDADLLVIVDSVVDRRAMRVAMRRAVNGLGLPKDIILLTQDEYEARRQVPGIIPFWASRDGEVLYAA